MKLFIGIFLSLFFHCSLGFTSDSMSQEPESLNKTSGVWTLRYELDKKDPKLPVTYVKSSQITAHNDLNNINNTYYLSWENRTQIPVVIKAKNDYLFPDSKGTLMVKAGSEVTVLYLFQKNKTMSKVEGTTMAVLPKEFEEMSEYLMIVTLANQLVHPEPPFTIRTPFSQIILALSKVTLDKEWVINQFWKN